MIPYSSESFSNAPLCHYLVYVYFYLQYL